MIDNIKCPCKECKMRVLGCHSKCEHYKDYKELVSSANAAQRYMRQSHPVLRMGDFLGDDAQMGRSNILNKKNRKPGKSHGIAKRK